MTRSATRSRSAEATAAPVRAIVRDFSRAATTPYAVEFDVRTVYDFLLSLSKDAGTTEDLPETDRVWLREAKASLPAALRTELDDQFGADICVVVAGLAVGRPELVDARSFVEFLRAIDPHEFVRTILGEYQRDPVMSPFLDRALGGEPAAIERIRLELDEHKLSLADRLLGDPTELIRSTVAILEAWYERFAPIEERIRSMIRRDADARIADRATLEPIDLIEKTTGGIRQMPERGVRRVVLAPSYFARPYNYHLTADDWKFFGYPVADFGARGLGPAGAAGGGRPASPGPGGRDTPAHPPPARQPRPLPDRDRRGTRVVEADHQAPPCPAPGGRAGHPDRGGRAVLLQPSTRHDRGNRQRAPGLPAGLTHAGSGRGPWTAAIPGNRC